MGWLLRVVTGAPDGCVTPLASVSSLQNVSDWRTHTVTARRVAIIALQVEVLNVKLVNLVFGAKTWKNVFTFFGHFYVFNAFFIFQTFFIFKKFRAASRLTKSTFKITATKQTYDSFCKTKLNGIYRVALKAISWTSGVELNCTKKT